MRHSFSVDAVGLVQGVGNLKYEFFDANQRGITAHVLANFVHEEIPISGIVSRRYYFRNDRWSAFVAPYASYMQINGNYTPSVEDEDGTIVEGSESLFKSKSTNLGLSIGYSYVGLGGFCAAAEFGYGYAVMFNTDWQGDPPTNSTESTLKSIVPLIFNVTAGYAF